MPGTPWCRVAGGKGDLDLYEQERRYCEVTGDKHNFIGFRPQVYRLDKGEHSPEARQDELLLSARGKNALSSAALSEPRGLRNLPLRSSGALRGSVPSYSRPAPPPLVRSIDASVISCRPDRETSSIEGTVTRTNGGSILTS